MASASFQEPMKPSVRPKIMANAAPAALPADNPVICATWKVCLARVVVRPPGPFLGSSKKPMSCRTSAAKAAERNFRIRPSWSTVKKTYFRNSPTKPPKPAATK